MIPSLLPTLALMAAACAVCALVSFWRRRDDPNIVPLPYVRCPRCPKCESDIVLTDYEDKGGPRGLLAQECECGYSWYQATADSVAA